MTQQPSEELHGARFQTKERLCSEARGPTWRWVEAVGSLHLKLSAKGPESRLYGFYGGFFM